MEQHVSVAHPAVKILTAWAATLGLSTWSDLAALLAAIYSLILISEWFWKKCGRHFAEQRGWAKPRKRRADDPK